MAQTHLTVLKQQQQEIQNLKLAMHVMQDKQDKMPIIKLPAMMETPRVPKPQDLEYQTLLGTTKRLKEKKEEREQLESYKKLAKHTQAYLRHLNACSRRSVRGYPKLHD
jgi:hypothetical protein